MTQYVQLSADTAKVITVFGGPQNAADKPGYTEVADTDARYLAFQATKTAQVAAAALLAGGITITSTANGPALNGLYGLDPASQQKITSEQLYIATAGKFTNGQTTRAWPDINGALHTFPSPAEFTAFAEACAQAVDAVAAALQVVQDGGTWTAPTMTATIA